MTKLETAALLERFLKNQPLYPQEWNDFVDTKQQDSTVEASRKRCETLDPLINRPGDPDSAATRELESIVEALRK